MKNTFQSTFEDRNEELYEVTVTGIYFAGSIGVHHGFDRFAEPDEPANFEIESVVEVGTGREFFEDDNPEAWEKLIEEGIERTEEQVHEADYEF